MKFSHFFIDRPIFASVLSIVIVLVGGLALFQLPVAQFPDIVPPTVVVSARYPGANPTVLADTVAAPIEQEVNGVENMLYMSAQCSADGSMSLTITFKLGTDVDKAQVQVQNRVAVAIPRLPDVVRSLGVTTVKRSPDITLIVNLISPDRTLDKLYIDNYAYLQVKDSLSRLPGVGNVTIFGARDYSMRVWLDPAKVASRGLTAGDVVRAIREQNVQVAAGVLGQQPMVQGVPFQFIVNAQGRLVDQEQFADIVVKIGADGQIARVRDVARVELAARDYSMDSKLNGEPNASIAIFQLPGSNSIETSDAVHAAMEQLKERFPPGLDYRIVFDTTSFTRESISAVLRTLTEAMLLVVLVVVIFLQSWRASLIPLLAVPVSLIGTFAAMSAMGFSLNNLSLFGLVLAIGIVVDDAIVVVENVERHIAEGLSPRDATRQAMNEVSGAVIAVGLVLAAVFIPTAFISGITGQFYRQFALTIAVSTLISAFNSLTLSPALCALLLQPHHARVDLFTRLLNGVFGWFFRGFNTVFGRSTQAYSRTVGRLIRFSAATLVVYAGLIALTWFGFRLVPTGFIPQQDKGYLAMMVQLPDAASLERTGEVVDRVSKIARAVPGVKATIDLAGLSPISLAASPNAGTIFVILDDFNKRKQAGLSSDRIVGELRQRCAVIQEGIVMAFPPPAVNGLGIVGGFKMQVEDRAGAGLEALQAATFQLANAAGKQPGIAGAQTSFRATVPQILVDVDRSKAKTMNVALSDVFEALQIYLGSLYVNDFNLFGRTYQVTAQADAQFRRTPEDIVELKTRNAAGQMVPLGTLVKVKETTGPDRIVRYNMYPSAELNGSPLPGISSGEAIATMEKLAQETLPPGMGFEWTELTLQEILAGSTAIFIFPLCVLFVFLTLAAQYESWSLPLAIILIVPMCLLSAIAGTWLRGMDNNIFTQIGFVVLVGLACKNAILIVEFARQRQNAGLARAEAAVEASRLRLRPILMTSFAFIFGVVPLVFASGAGAEMRRALGTAVFSGMLGVTFFGILLTPVFYVVIRAVVERFWEKRQDAASAGTAASASKTIITLLALLSLTLFSGCAVGPNYRPPESRVNAAFANGVQTNLAPGATIALWWRNFHDAQLDRLVDDAIRGNHDLRIATARVLEARALRLGAKSDFFPAIQAGGGYTESLSSKALLPAVPRDQRKSELFDAGFDATWELDLFGRVRRSVEASRAQVEATRADRRAVLVSLVSEVARNYIELRGAQYSLDVARRNAANQAETLEMTESKLQAGMTTELDAARARAQLNSTLAAIPPIQVAIQRARHRLAVLTGREPTALNAELAETKPLPNLPALVSISNPAELLRRRPDIQAAERSLAAATARIGVATADLFPRVTFNGNISLQADTFSGLGQAGADTYSFGPRLTWAALDYGHVRARIHAAGARAEAALAAYELTVLTALEETENALVEFGQQQVRRDFLRAAATAAEQAMALARERYRGGIADFLQVLDTERTLLLIQEQLALSETRAATALVAVYKSLGDGWQTDTPLP